MAARNSERAAYRRSLSAHLRTANMQYPEYLTPLPKLVHWLALAVRDAQAENKVVDRDVISISMWPTLTATAHRSMWAYGNHFRVQSAEHHLTTMDCGVAATFDQWCVSGPNDQNPVFAPVEYVGKVEEILDIDYGRFRTTVMLCNWVQATCHTMKRDAYGFTLVNFNRHIPISAESFCFPMHVEQVFFSESPMERGWHIVLRKEPRGRRGEGNRDSAPEVQLLSLGNDNDFVGLIPATTIRDDTPISPNVADGVPLTAYEVVAAQVAVDARLSDEGSEEDEDQLGRQYSSSDDEGPSS